MLASDRGITATPLACSVSRRSRDKDSFSNLHEPLNAPLWVPFWPIISLTPALAVRLTRPPKVLQRRIHMAQPLPYLLQLAGGPAVPVVSMNTSPAIRIDAFRRFPVTAVIRVSAISASVMRVNVSMVMPLCSRNRLMMGSMVATLYKEA